MTLKIRDATQDDASLLLQVIDLASDGLIPKMWSDAAPEGVDREEVGRAQVLAEEGDFSYRFGIVVENAGKALGGMVHYPLPATPDPAGEDVPDAFLPIMDLVGRVPGYWYINFMAVLPEGRGQGLGRMLLTAAETRARDHGCPGLALVVAASNSAAIHLYTKVGFREQARCPFDLSGYNMTPTEALLMVREFD